MKLSGRCYIDGGVMANNPAVIALNEARQMANPPSENWRMNTEPKLLVSLGTGKSQQHSRFGRVSILKWIFKSITDTQAAHNNASAMVQGYRDSKYFRFDVPERPENIKHKGLSHVGMAQCRRKKKKKQVTKNSNAENGKKSGPKQDNDNSTSLDQSVLLAINNLNQQGRITTFGARQLVINRDTALQESAKETSIKGGYRPDIYDYITYDKIRDRTITYCSSQDEQGRRIADLIGECAELLWTQSQKRRDLPGGRQRWKEFRTHPHPDHSSRAL
jgi:hypothetical protein